MSTGDIRNGPYATRAKEYVWSTIRDAFPRGITPTDIDGMVEINNCFFIFEGKTEGKQIETGQQLALKRLMLSLPPQRAVAVLGEHSSMERVNVATELRRLKIGWTDAHAMRWSPWCEPACIANVAALFVRDAEAGRLRPDGWHEEVMHAQRPFEEAS